MVLRGGYSGGGQGKSDRDELEGFNHGLANTGTGGGRGGSWLVVVRYRTNPRGLMMVFR